MDAGFSKIEIGVATLYRLNRSLPMDRDRLTTYIAQKD